MELVHWVDHPALRRPLFVIAFEGWNDAGDAATLALDYLAQEWRAHQCATIDPEEFYDFTVTRPDRQTDLRRRPHHRVASRRGAGRRGAGRGARHPAAARRRAAAALADIL